MSPVYFARPVTRSTASMLGPRLPMTFSEFAGVGRVLLRHERSPYACIRRDAAMTDSRMLLVRGAAAQIAGEPAPRLLFGRARHPVEQRLGGHDLAGGAEAALVAAVLDERLLDRMQRVAVGQALDRQHLGAGLSTASAVHA